MREVVIACLTFSAFPVIVLCCGNKTTVICQTSISPGMSDPCQEAFCSCNTSLGYFLLECIGIFNHMPLDIPKDAEAIDFQQNNITTIRSGILSELQLLFSIALRNNSIYIIESGSFLDLPQLSKIDLSDNNIEVIETKTFTELQSIKTINLSMNSIHVIKKESFTELPKLETIDLTGNNITVIENKAFSNLPSLQILDLRAQFITVIESYAFSNLLSITEINLSNNKITRLNRDIFVELPKLTTIDLDSNLITVIESYAFDSLESLYSVKLTGNNVEVIQSRAFNNLSSMNEMGDIGYKLLKLESEAFSQLPALYKIQFSVGDIQILKERSFFNLDNLTSISLSSGGSRLEIEKYAFYNLPALKDLTIFAFVTVIKTFAFCNLPALSNMGIPHTRIQLIEQNAFWNVHGSSLYFRIERNFVMLENSNMNFSTLYFAEYQITCNCSFMWLPLWKEEIGSVSIVGSCAVSNLLTNDLTLQNFADCYDKTEVATCNASKTIKLQCPAAYIVSDVQTWIHTKNGQLIRTLNSSNKYSDVLEINHCNYADEGEYACVRTTNYTALPEFNNTVKLKINGEVHLEPQTYCNKSAGLELKCTIDIGGWLSTYWTHSSKGTMIRQFIGAITNSINNLVIPFCNFQDIGEYTCIWQFPGNVILNKTTTLFVNGPPVITSYSVRHDKSDKIISVLFYSQPFPNEPHWYFDSNLVELGQKFVQTTSFDDVTVRQHGVYVKTEGFHTTLTLVDLDSKSYGKYRCVITNSYGSTETEIDVRKDESVTSTNDSQTTVIVASVTSLFVLMAVIIVVILVCIKRRKRQKRETSYESSGERRVSEVYDEIQNELNRDSTNRYDYIHMSKTEDEKHNYMQVF